MVLISKIKKTNWKESHFLTLIENSGISQVFFSQNFEVQISFSLKNRAKLETVDCNFLALENSLYLYLNLLCKILQSILNALLMWLENTSLTDGSCSAFKIFDDRFKYDDLNLRLLFSFIIQQKLNIQYM